MHAQEGSSRLEGPLRQPQSFESVIWEGKDDETRQGCATILPRREPGHRGAPKGSRARDARLLLLRDSRGFPKVRKRRAGRRAFPRPVAGSLPLSSRAAVAAAPSPSALWPRSPAGRSPPALPPPPRPPPSWSLFNDAPCDAFWDEAAAQPIRGPGGRGEGGVAPTSPRAAGPPGSASVGGRRPAGESGSRRRAGTACGDLGSAALAWGRRRGSLSGRDR